MRQNVGRTVFVRILRRIEIVHSTRFSVTDIQPIGMGVEVIDVQVVLFQKCCRKPGTIILRLLVLIVVCRRHNTLNSDISAVAVSTAVSGVPAGEAKGQILPSTGVVYIIMYSDVFHIAIVSCSGVLLRRCRSTCYRNPICVVNSNTDNFALHRNGGHIDVVWIVFCEQKFVDGYTAKSCCVIRFQNCHCHFPP